MDPFLSWDRSHILSHGELVCTRVPSAQGERLSRRPTLWLPLPASGALTAIGLYVKRGKVLKNVLDLLEEFGKLSDAKTDGDGYLPPKEERRWMDLKSLYDGIMSSAGSGNSPLPSVHIDEVRRRLKHRGRLRVRTDMDAFFRHKDMYLSSRLVNVSRGGLFLGSDVILDRGVQITVYLPNLAESYGDLFENKAEVAWTNRLQSREGLPRGMGMSFRDIGGKAAMQLDSYIVETISERISGKRVT